MKCPLCGEAAAFLCKTTLPHVGAREYYKCPACALVFVPAAFHLSEAEERRHYESHKNDPEDGGYRAFLSKLADPLCARLKPGARGLDFGCGPGPTLCRLLEERGHKVVNYDPHYFPDEELLLRKYDFVTASEVVEHLRAPRQTFEQLAGLLKGKGGLLAVMTEVAEPAPDFTEWWYARDPTHVCFYSPQTLEWIGKWRGWRLDRVGKNVAIYEL